MVYQRKTSKEIAALTGTAVGTVDGYIAEGVALLDARNRRHAAELLHAAMYPEKLPPEIAWVAPDAAIASSDVEPKRRVGWSDLLPFRRPGAFGNDLSPFLRVLWIVQLAAVLAIGFGMLAVGTEVLSRLYGRH